MHTELFVKHDENVVIISMRIGKELKTVISILVNSAARKKTNSGKMKKSRKTIENTLINLYCIDFFYCNKKLQKIGFEKELLHLIKLYFLR